MTNNQEGNKDDREMNILIVINDLGSGGAQRSLISFLQCLEEKNLLDKYNIDLLVSDRAGIFLEKVPSKVNILDTAKNIMWMNCPLSNRRLLKKINFEAAIYKIKWIITRKINIACGNFYTGKTLWENWKNVIPKMEKKYDVAISYMDGWPNYYVIEKVQACKKVLWIHNEYQKLNYDANYDINYYSKCDKIITISKECLNSFVSVFPEYKDKICILENITLARDILRKAEEEVASEFIHRKNVLKILSIGRLSQQKAFDLAIMAARKLREKKVEFFWLILGEGSERSKLEKLIHDNNLDHCVSLVGIKSNPYPYIRECDIFVQTSRFEGKSIVLDEAKIFAKPIVVTNYDTVYDSISHMENGLISEMDAESIALNIIKLQNDQFLRKTLTDKLRNESHGNEDELQKYISVMLREE